MHTTITVHPLFVIVYPQFHQHVDLPNGGRGRPTLKIIGNKEAGITRCHFPHVINMDFPWDHGKV